MEKCMRCNHDLIIENNFMLSEIIDLTSDDEDTMITSCKCPYCGLTYEIAETPESEKKNLPYWNNVL